MLSEAPPRETARLPSEEGPADRRRAQPKGRRKRPGQWTQFGWITLFLAPALVAIVVLRIVPAVVALSNSFYLQIPGSVLGAKFVGLGNYLSLIDDDAFRQVIGVTLLFTVIVNPVQVVLALALAVLIVRRVRGATLVRILLFIPVTVPVVCSAIIWGIVLNPDGPVNGFLRALGLGAQPFFTSPRQALLCVVVVCSWIGVGFLMTFLIAGLQALPREIYEAAEIDRSGPFRTFFQITVPLLRRQILFVLVTATAANFVVFAPIQLLTNGGPQGSTDILMFDAYNQWFGIGNSNKGAAEIVILMIIMLVVVGLQFRLIREEKS